MPPVSVVRCSEQSITEALERGLTLLGITPSAFSDEDMVVIKPNLCDLRSPESGTTTDTRVVEAMIRYIRSASRATILVVESDHWVATADEGFDQLGYREMAEEMGVKLVNLSRDVLVTIEVNGKYFKELRAPETLLKATKIISIPKMKTHGQHRITCVMKNHFGLIPSRYRSRYHPYMDEVLFDLCNVFKPYLCVVDAIYSMEGLGPSDGSPVKTELLICGQDALAVDSVVSKIMVFKPDSVPHLKYARKHGLGSAEDVTIVGDSAGGRQFEFIPLAAYKFYRLSLKFNRLGNSFRSFFNHLSNLSSQAALGVLVLQRGSVVTSLLGTLDLDVARRYVRGLLKRFLLRIGMTLGLA